MTIFAYLRVSTGGQDLDAQRLAILDYAHLHRFAIDQFVHVQMSSRKSMRERGIDELLQKLQKDDLVVVSELSRLGRSVGQVIQIVDELVKKAVRFVAIKESIRLDGGTQDINSKMMVTLFSLFAEIERDLISQRTKEGLMAARAQGKCLGRPKGVLGPSKLDGKEEQVKILLEKKVSKASIAKILDVSRSTLLHFIHSRKIG